MSGQLEFISGEDMEVLNAAEHFLATDLEWDPTGRYVATAVTSMANGCVYCTSVHARRFAELTKQPEAMQRILDEGFEAETDPRRRAIAAYADKLTRTPAAVGLADLRALREAGLDDLQILDLNHSIAMFANANRLMQSLGETGRE